MYMLRIRFFPVILATCLLLGAWGTAQAAPVATASVGFVDFIYLVNQHPDTPKANEVLLAEQNALKQELETKLAGLGDKEKQEFGRQIGQQLEKKRMELLKPISDKVVAAANEVAYEKGLSIVIGKNEVICGGVDITADVLKKITGK
ncbi:MAG: periplasmic chaperone [Firmicutes bacterium]|nr:periplasmic chaperone [Bacillota bacterium]